MRRILGSLVLGLGLATAPLPAAFADDPEAEAHELVQEEQGSSGLVILGAVAVLVAVGGAVAFLRRT